MTSVTMTIAYHENVRFIFSKEDDIGSGSGTRLDHSRAFVEQSFINVRKGTERTSDLDIRRRVTHSLVFSKGVVYFLN